MEINTTCEDLLLSNTSSTSSKIGLDYSCDRLLREFKNKPKEASVQNTSAVCECPPGDYLDSSSSTISKEIFNKEYCSGKETINRALNISYETAVAKSLMQQLSSISGDNLFDHLSDIIKRVIDEKPPNVIDFFEEFSRNIREQKFHLPERFPPEAVYEEKRLFKLAKKQLIAMKLPYPAESTIVMEEELEEEQSKDDIQKFQLKYKQFDKLRIFNDSVQHLQFFWNQCGFSISSEDIFQLACSMDRLQTHPSIMQCRFWGMINGLKASYYIVEAILTKDEYESRLLQMEKEMYDNFMASNIENGKNCKLPSHIGPELTPGAVGWENYSKDDILKMQSKVLNVPVVRIKENFNIPPEPIGKGVNRYSYFVVNALSDEWMELPVVTPTQIQQSRDIKKFFTGDLEEDIVSYPCFYGKEKHYLRAMIARITAGTYIAPRNYYRKITTKERKLFEGGENGEEDVEEGEEDESQIGEEEADDEKEIDNDVILLKNEQYDYSIPLSMLNSTDQWVHVRPNILVQGRVAWYDHVKAEREREKKRKRLEKTHSKEEINENESDNTEEEEDDDDDEESEQEHVMEDHAEKGPAIFTSCSRDVNSETSTPWVARFTSKFTNQTERILVMQSNLWPGAYTFVFKDICESIYLGWGHKLVSRNMTWKHLPPVKEEYKHKVLDFIETIDPSVQMEEEYKLSLLNKQLKLTQMKGSDEYGPQDSSNEEEDSDEEEEEDGEDEED